MAHLSGIDLSLRLYCRKLPDTHTHTYRVNMWSIFQHTNTQIHVWYTHMGVTHTSGHLHPCRWSVNHNYRDEVASRLSLLKTNGACLQCLHADEEKSHRRNNGNIQKASRRLICPRHIQLHTRKLVSANYVCMRCKCPHTCRSSHLSHM